MYLTRTAGIETPESKRTGKRPTMYLTRTAGIETSSSELFPCFSQPMYLTRTAGIETIF